MATRYYTFLAIESGSPATGQTFTVTSFRALTNAANLTPLPTITEYGNGVYGIGVDPEVVGDDSVVTIDLGASCTSGGQRYIEVVSRLSDSRTTFALGPNGVNLPANQPVEVGSYAADMSPAEQVLGTLGHVPLATNVTTGAVELDPSQTLSLTPTAGTVGEALLAARAQGFGAWALVGTSLILYAPDGATPVRTFTLNSATNPTARA